MAEGRTAAQCDGCGSIDTDPKLHYGAQTYHHDCVPFWIMRDVTEKGYYDRDTGAWVADPDGEDWSDDARAAIKRVVAVIQYAKDQKPVTQDGKKGEKLLAHIQKIHKEN